MLIHVILDQQSDQCNLECYDYQKKSILVFNKFHLIFICLFVPKNEKEKIYNMSSAIVINIVNSLPLSRIYNSALLVCKQVILFPVLLCRARTSSTGK